MFNNNNNSNDNSIITLFTLQNGSASTIIKAGIDPCVAIIKYSITSISMKKISATGKKINYKTKLASNEQQWL